jgi:hypothetical protein
VSKWSDGLKRFFKRTDFTVKASGAEIASTTGATVEVGEGGNLNVVVDITAASGTTPTMTVVIEGSTDGTNWYALGTFGANGYAVGSVATAPTNITGVSTIRGALPGARYVRYRSVIGGTTPSFTYSVTAEVEGN